jgi:hypothetical protein
LLRWQVKWSAKGIEALAEWERFYGSNLPAPLFMYVTSSKIYCLVSSPLHDALVEMAEDAVAHKLEEVVEEEEDDNAQLSKVTKARAKGKAKLNNNNYNKHEEQEEVPSPPTRRQRKAAKHCAVP